MKLAVAFAVVATACSPSGDVCTSITVKQDDVDLQIRTAEKCFPRYRLCVTGPKGKVCKVFPIESPAQVALRAFTSHTCASCHTLKAAKAGGIVGPDLDNLPSYAAKAHQPLESFIRTSILKPNAYVEPGFPKNTMPSFSDMPEDQLSALVSFLATGGKDSGDGYVSTVRWNLSFPDQGKGVYSVKWDVSAKTLSFKR